MTQPRSLQIPDYDVSDEAAACIAEMLMELALQFEADHFDQIRRHYQSMTPGPDDGQLDLFDNDLFDQEPPF
jgi:hypothetical protein